MKKMLTAGMILLSLGTSSAWAEEGYKPHKIQSGETLSKIARQHGVKDYHDIMKANGLSSDRIFAGEMLRIPVDKMSKFDALQKIGTRKLAKSSPFVWKKVGGNPYKGTPEWAINHSTLPADIKAKVLENIQQDKFEWYTEGIASGQHFDWMTFGKNEVEYDFNTDWDSTRVYAAKDYGVNGYRVLHVMQCRNWGGWKEETPEPKPDEPDIPDIPDVPDIPDIPIEPPEDTTPEKALSLWDWELFGITGGETDFGGNEDVFLGLEGALYPFIVEGKNAKDEFGIGGKANFWAGENFEGFKFDGGYAAGGPAWKHIGYSGWDTGVKLLIGNLWENGEDDSGDYESSRRFSIAGISASYNNQERELRGEKFFPEWGLYGAIFIPLSRDVEHSWQGQDIADTKDLEKFNYLLSIGGRVFLYQGEYLRPYIQAGYFSENPITHSLSFRLGVSDVHKIIFAGIGPNINLDSGNLSAAGDIGIDIMRAVEFGRAKHRRNAMIAAIQNRPEVKEFDVNTGVLILKP